jgi:hypothetical protein
MEAKVTVDEELELEDELDTTELKARCPADMFNRARNSVKSNICPLLVKMADNSALSFAAAASLSAASFALALLMLSIASRKTDAILE